MDRYPIERPYQATRERPHYTPTAMNPAAPQAPPLAIQVNVAPRMTNAIHQDGVATLLAGLIIGFAAGWYFSQSDDEPKV